MNTSHYSGGDSHRGKKASLVPVVRREMTTVRIRTKNNSFVYGEQSMDELNESRMLDPQEINMMWQKKRQTQEKIQEYKEIKLQMQI